MSEEREKEGGKEEDPTKEGERASKKEPRVGEEVEGAGERPGRSPIERRTGCAAVVRDERRRDVTAREEGEGEPSLCLLLLRQAVGQSAVASVLLVFVERLEQI